MPTVAVDNVLTLPRVATPDPAVARSRAVRSVSTSTHGLEGEGFPVRRAFDPFLH